MAEQPFVDYYQLLQIGANAEIETIQRVYGMLAYRYRPENPHTGDAERFNRLNRAYEILSNRESRASYDRAYQLIHEQPLSVFELKEFEPGIDGERNRRLGLLCMLYNRRRTTPEAGGLSILNLETRTGFRREHLQFTLWCLKESQLIRQDETTDFALTGRGAEFLEANLASNPALYEMMKAAELGDFSQNPANVTTHTTA